MSSLQKYPNYLQATYQKNERYGSQTASSQLVHQLRQAEWVPQNGGAFVKPSNASRDLLPEGFAFDQGWEWLKAIQFGISLTKKSEEQKQADAIAKKLGFADPGTLERAQRFAALPPEEQERILADEELKVRIELPDHEPANPERRAERVAEQAATAPQRRSEERTRSVAIGLESIKEQAAQYLLNQYTTDGEMICQVCKRPVPFKLDDGTPYFEKVEFLPELKNRHYQNYVGLCPNHAAMFLYANGSSKCMKSNFLEMTGNELRLMLAHKDLTIYFTKMHAADLRAVIESDTSEVSEGDKHQEPDVPSQPTTV
jgi:hypothetical protein